MGTTSTRYLVIIFFSSLSPPHLKFFPSSATDMDLFEVTDDPARVLEVVSSAAHRQARVA